MAVKVTSEPVGKSATQVDPQSMPAGLVTIRPCPNKMEAEMCVAGVQVTVAVTVEVGVRVME